MAIQEIKQRPFPGTVFHSKNLSSSASVVACYVCGKGLQDGHSIIAKTIPSGIVLFCNVHCPLQ
jgi:hypothetical protein